jgi:hypothetical protein
MLQVGFYIICIRSKCNCVGVKNIEVDVNQGEKFSLPKTSIEEINAKICFIRLTQD